MAARWSEAKKHFIFNQIGAITLRSMMLWIIPFFAIQIVGFLSADAHTLAIVGKFIGGLLVVLVGGFSFCFTFIALARFLALMIRVPMSLPIYFAMVLMLVSPILFSMLSGLEKNVAATAAYLLFPFIYSGYLLWRADRKAAGHTTEQA